TIGGSASMMDFPGLAHVAHGMEDILGDVLDGVSTLDLPTIGLLQRSLGRMHKLLQGIHKGIDEEAIMAEDDADYVRYRSLTDSSMQSSAPALNGSADNQHLLETSIPSPTDPSTQMPAASSMPSLDEVLASFRTSPVSANQDIDWPEEPAPAEPVYESQPEHVAAPLFEEQPTEIANLETNTTPEPEPVNPSALERLVASTSAQPAHPFDETVALSTSPQHLEQESAAPTETDMVGVTDPQQPSLVTHPAAIPQATELAIPSVFSAMHEDAQSIAVQASSLNSMLKQLRMAMTVIEDQRSEFKGFLDGSRDALDRMEDWAGQAMGLNLRNSPDQVRRYLPLSVMWVSNTKLKKVLDLLTQITSGVEMTDEQLHNALQQLSSSIEACGDAFQQVLANNPPQMFTHDQGWTPWEMRVSREAEAMRERVTFERHGDPATLRSEIEAAVREEFRREQEAKMREEIRREYENRPLTLAARSELERQLRNEIRQEFVANRQLQERVSGSENT
ncbi:MAG TPA: hypothetical protein VIY29_30655, partial [Ktedonobacteraceae bacterium]